MKKAILIFVFGLLLSGCLAPGWESFDKPINSSGGHVRIYGDPPITKIMPIANGNCRSFNSQSKAINLKQVHAGTLFYGEFSYWHYDCESVQARIEKQKVELASMIDKAKDTCKSLGFTEGTEKFSDCSLKLYSQSIALAAANNQQVVIQGSGSNVMTIYDPVRDNNALIKRGQGLINGTCTFANLSTC